MTTFVDFRPRFLERFPLLRTWVQPLQRFVALSLSLFVILVVLRVYEFLVVSKEHSMPENSLSLFFQAIGYDAILLLLFSGLLLIPYLLLSSGRQRAGSTFYGAAALLFVMADVGLLQYFFVTFVPLGADLFGYSLQDSRLTVSSSGGFSLLTIVPFLAAIGLVWAAIVFLARKKAFAQSYDEARATCKKLLKNGPNYHDIRTLLGKNVCLGKTI